MPGRDYTFISMEEFEHGIKLVRNFYSSSFIVLSSLCPPLSVAFVYQHAGGKWRLNSFICSYINADDESLPLHKLFT